MSAGERDLAGVRADTFRSALRRHASGVVIVTGGAPDAPVGFTATSFTSVSLEPPLVSFCVRTGSASWAGLRRHRHFGINILAAGQEDLAHRFAQRGAARFATPTEWHRGDLGLPFLAGDIARLTCRRRQVRRLGDHLHVVGLVVGTELGGDDSPLVRHMGRFHGLAAQPHSAAGVD
ncbi:flavin reductase [Actinomadura darangshiensis]|uniref:Flavin reductase n=1 Tax=Actinomadura darangshiensis TaxID=705336 RepID=A0A4R5BYV3_9ACTN|nr:flavin reductase family protein [Actinomadura darangshiensis]TDD89624.1 flavin reductase [Actinomadura darangshiensis]